MSTDTAPSVREPLFSFPNPVNEVSARLVATGVVLMASAIVLFDLTWLTIPLAYGFVARVLTGPKLSPLGQLVTRVITPALPFEAKLVPGPPKRFAEGMGVAFSVTAAVLTFGFDAFGAAQVVLGMLIVAASLEAFVGLCLGCKVFAIGMRLGLIPEEVCEKCNDLWGTKAARDAEAVAAWSTISERDRRQVIRLVAAGVVILSFAALAWFAIAASRSDVAVTVAKRAAERALPPTEQLPEVPALASFTSPAPSPAPGGFLGAIAVPMAAAPTADATLAPPPELAEVGNIVPPCFLGIPPADTSGGLANLIDIVPLFGSFSPEVFAFLPVMEPMLAAGSPLLPVFEQLITAGAPLLDVGVPAVNELVNALFDGVSAFYTPVRPQVLAAEEQFATAIAPLVEQILTAPGSECAIAAEGQLADLLGALLPPANP